MKLLRIMLWFLAWFTDRVQKIAKAVFKKLSLGDRVMIVGLSMFFAGLYMQLPWLAYSTVGLIIFIFGIMLNRN